MNSRSLPMAVTSSVLAGAMLFLAPRRLSAQVKSAVALPVPPEPDFFASVETAPVMPDWNHQPLFFANDPASVYFAPDLVTSGRGRFKGELVNKAVDWSKVFQTFRVSVLANGKPVPPANIVFTPEARVFRGSTHVYGRVTLTIKGGWPQGDIVITGGLDTVQLGREMGLNVEATEKDQARQIRFRVRAKASQDDELLRLRFEAVRLQESAAGFAPDFETQRRAVQRLLDVYPDDLFGHAWLGFVEECEWSGYRVNPALTAEQVRQENLQHAQDILSHYKQVYATIDKTSGVARGFGQGQAATPRTDAFKALRFNSWLGATGPRALLETMRTKMWDQELAIAKYQSPAFFRVSELRAPALLLNRLRDPQDAFSQWLRTKRWDANAVTALDAQTLKPNAQVSLPLQNFLVQLFDLLLAGDDFYAPLQFKGITLSPTSQKFLKGAPRSADELVLLRRSLLQDAYPGVFSPLDEVKAQVPQP